MSSDKRRGPGRPRTADRHKPGSRKTATLHPALYELLKALALDNDRYLHQELRLAVKQHLLAAGLRDQLAQAGLLTPGEDPPKDERQA